MNKAEYIKKMDDLISEASISERDRKIIEEAYYKDGCCFGRDGLYHYLKNKTKEQNIKTPSFRVVAKWLKQQALQQEYQQQRKGGTTDYFHPVSPFHSISIDLIDFNNKPAKQFRYILVVVDNFSRKMFVEPITSKETAKTTPAMSKILDRIKAESGKTPKFLICDDGSEWKAEFIKLLKDNEIDKRRTLGGQPQANGMVERANGKIKMLMAKNMTINGGSWLDNLPKSLNAYNNQWIRTTEYTPNEALQLKTETQLSKLVENVETKHKEEYNPEFSQSYKVDDKVRVKLNKGTLGKSSTPSWSSRLYTIGQIVKSKTPTVADKYKIKELAQDQNYSRNDLQLVEGTPEQIPIKPKKKRENLEGILEVDMGTFTKLEEEAEQRAKRERKQVQAFDPQRDGLNDTQRKKLAKATTQKAPAQKATQKTSGRARKQTTAFNPQIDGANDTTRKKLARDSTPPKRKTAPLSTATPPPKQRAVVINPAIKRKAPQPRQLKL